MKKKAYFGNRRKGDIHYPGILQRWRVRGLRFSEAFYPTQHIHSELE